MEEAENKTHDIALVTRALEEPKAFDAIVRHYQDAVFGVALTRVRDFHAAEEITQEVLIEAFERLSTLKDPARLGAWLRSITVHHCIDSFRKKRFHVDVDETPDLESDQPEPDAELEGKQVREQVMTAIGQLGKAEQETTLLFYINGYSQNEVATMQAVPLGTVKRRLHDARKKLKESMMPVVENVLKESKPKEDFSKRVYDLLTAFQKGGNRQLWRNWKDVVKELREIGTDGIEGFIQAFASPYAKTRKIATSMLQRHVAPQTGDLVLDILKRGILDSNKKVRRAAVEALLHMKMDEERKKKEIVPLTTPLMLDKSARVRKMTYWYLARYAGTIPSAMMHKAILNENRPGNQHALKRLLSAHVRQTAT